jgi:hypothetical protein
MGWFPPTGYFAILQSSYIVSVFLSQDDDSVLSTLKLIRQFYLFSDSNKLQIINTQT